MEFHGQACRRKTKERRPSCAWAPMTLLSREGQLPKRKHSGPQCCRCHTVPSALGKQLATPSLYMLFKKENNYEYIP